MFVGFPDPFRVLTQRLATCQLTRDSYLPRVKSTCRSPARRSHQLTVVHSWRGCLAFTLSILYPTHTLCLFVEFTDPSSMLQSNVLQLTDSRYFMGIKRERELCSLTNIKFRTTAEVLERHTTFRHTSPVIRLRCLRSIIL